MPVVHLEVHGRVQGVGYRWFIRERARHLDLAGWVRNRDDGAVEIAASGSDDAVQTLVRVAEKGPPGAHVSGVRQLPADSLGDLPRPFAIVR